jgi:hypothetical protein
MAPNPTKEHQLLTRLLPPGLILDEIHIPGTKAKSCNQPTIPKRPDPLIYV